MKKTLSIILSVVLFCVTLAGPASAAFYKNTILKNGTPFVFVLSSEDAGYANSTYTNPMYENYMTFYDGFSGSRYEIYINYIYAESRNRVVVDYDFYTDTDIQCRVEKFRIEDVEQEENELVSKIQSITFVVYCDKCMIKDIEYIR